MPTTILDLPKTDRKYIAGYETGAIDRSRGINPRPLPSDNADWARGYVDGHQGDLKRTDLRRYISEKALQVC